MFHFHQLAGAYSAGVGSQSGSHGDTSRIRGNTSTACDRNLESLIWLNSDASQGHLHATSPMKHLYDFAVVYSKWRRHKQADCKIAVTQVWYQRMWSAALQQKGAARGEALRAINRRCLGLVFRSRRKRTYATSSYIQPKKPSDAAFVSCTIDVGVDDLYPNCRQRIQNPNTDLCNTEIRSSTCCACCHDEVKS